MKKDFVISVNIYCISDSFSKYVFVLIDWLVFHVVTAISRSFHDAFGTRFNFVDKYMNKNTSRLFSRRSLKHISQIWKGASKCIGKQTY